MAAAMSVLAGCGVHVLYKDPTNTYAGRPIPPSNLLERVLASYTNGSSGGLEILDGYRDLRGNVQNTIRGYSISGYSGTQPTTIFNYPEQTLGYVLDSSGGTLAIINYGKETSSGSAGSFGARPPSVATTPTGAIIAGAAEQAGLLVLEAGGATYDLNLPNVYRVAVDPGSSVVLAMVRNSDTLYRVVKLPASVNPVIPPGSVDCEPLLLPLYCVVPVPGTKPTYDRPSNVSFSLDGSTAYILNSGPENGGTTASVTLLQMAALNINLIPTVSPLSPEAPSPLTALPVPNPIPIPGGVTAALSDGNYLYLSGQQLQASGPYKGLFAGNLTLLNLANDTAGAPISISDGTHTRMLFAEDNTLWIGSSQCANGVRAATASAELAAQGFTDQAGNYNCLTMVTTGSATPSATIIPAAVQSTVSTTGATPVLYPNTNQNEYYYGSMTGICWVQNYHKVYTAYGNQIHAFYTGYAANPTAESQYANVNGGAPGSEIDNYNITIQGNVYDVAYMDAYTNSQD